MVQSGDPQFVRYQDQTNASYLSLGGGPRRGNGYLLEGVPITDFTNRPTIVPSIEAIEDLKIQVKTYDADMGHSAGGVFNTAAKSGSNAWHGSALLVNKPEWATQRLYFTEKAGLAKPSQYFYDWGGSFGGPIVKDRTFFFATTEGYQQQGTRNAVLTLPTQAMRTATLRSGQRIGAHRALRSDVNAAEPGSARTVHPRPVPGQHHPEGTDRSGRCRDAPTMPLPTSGTTFNGVATLVDGPQNQQTIKVDHRWTDK